MSNPLQHYPDFRSIQEDLGLELDPATKFFVTPENNMVGVHRMFMSSSAALRPSEEGTFGPGVYIGNTPDALASFSRLRTMQTLVAVELPCSPAEALKIDKAFRFKRETFEQGLASLEAKPKLLVWKPGIGNSIGCVAMSGFRIPKKPMWGVWIDSETPIAPFAEINPA